ncbi:MAG TPA: hypothetical protein VLB45_06655 [Nitrosopumilaceae archaeon]|nr:hypothetical protein [Nitrosopumilaceae archaeon]
MVIQSKWVISDETTNQVTRAITIKPRLEYAASLVDGILDILAQKRNDLDKSNLPLYVQMNETKSSSEEFQNKMHLEIEISRAIEALRQAHRCLDSVFGLGNVPLVVSPTISIVRTVRSKLFGLIPEVDANLGELSLVLGGLIIDTGHLTSATLDFEAANLKSARLLDEAKLIADSKICKQFPNLDFP